MKKTLAPTPPMGWNSWDCYGAGVTEEALRENARFMAAHLLPYGWNTLVCDIQWYEPQAKGNEYNNFVPVCMDDYGRLLPAENRFPSAAGGKGFGPIADYCHSLGLRFGIHIMRGIPRQAVHRDTPILGTDYTARDAAHHFSVCAWNTDMYGMRDNAAAQAYYDSICRLYADWGVDFIKCDDICVTEFRKWDDPYNARHEIEMLHRSLQNCGREVVLSLSPGPADISNLPHLRRHAQMWRMTGDFWDRWDKLHDMFDRCKTWEGVPGPGCWPDCDMLPVGRLCKDAPYHGAQNRMSNFTPDEVRTMFTLWGIFRSPLFLGGDLPEMPADVLAMLTNGDYLQMHATSYGARELLRRETNGRGTIQWVACGRGCKYAAMFNTQDRPARQTLDLTALHLPDTPCDLTEIWSGEPLGTFKNRFSATVPAHGVLLLRITAE